MILQTRIPHDFGIHRPLPNVAPLSMNDWLLADEAFAAQMAERERLIAGQRDAVIAMDEGARAAAEELLQTVLGVLPGAFRREDSRVIRPDGVAVGIDTSDPMATLGRLVQEDLCLLEKRDGAEHLLTGAVLCFPAGWRLAQKYMRPLSEIHSPIPEYDAAIAARVQRLFDGVRPDRPLVRWNRLWHDDPALFQPGPRQHDTDRAEPRTAPYFRSERQCLVRLPETGAVAFSIHTYVVARDDYGDGLPAVETPSAAII